MSKPGKMVREWFRFAQEDLIATRALWEINNEHTWRAITFHSQQASEKAIKGYLTYQKFSFTKIHTIDILVKEVENLHPGLHELLMKARDLTPYAVQFRYPDSVTRELEKAEVEESMKIAKEVVKKMSELVPFDSLFDI